MLNIKPWAWCRKNLFATPTDTLITLLVGSALLAVIPDFFAWAFWDATWQGSTRAACTSDGACWVFIQEKFRQFMVGFYPGSEIYRVKIAGVLGLALGVLLFVAKFSFKKKLLIIALSAYPFVVWLLLAGGMFDLPPVPTSRWGGLMLTLIIATIGIVASLPLGIVLALGRRSQLPVVRTLSVVFIELWRAVPLITILFMASVMLPLFLPPGMTFDKLVRALVGVTLFSGAYMAEVVRGGLQAIPRGQYEAANALGLSYWKSMGLIILPQALKKVIPGIVNTFIGLFKDTTLVLIIGMFDLLGIVHAAATDPDWIGYAVEGYVFAGLVFWLFCFSMSRFSQRLETRLNTQH